MNRSARIDVRNPVLALPSVAELAALPEGSREALGKLLAEISRDAAVRAELAWRKKKGPMAAYWKAVSVYAKHIARALRGKR